MASNQQIISDLRLIKEADQSLYFLTVFKEVPFIYKARSESIQGDSVRLISKHETIAALKSGVQVRVLGSDHSVALPNCYPGEPGQLRGGMT